ncbi:MAG TPA: rod shape-determining protein MreC [Luteibaculaceae bacterium]|nr:rod shape-determining protein MreC [Luteibaculaceae bacterium]
MKNFFEFLGRYNKEIVAILLQALCLTFFFMSNSFQRSVLISSSNKVVGSVYEEKANLTRYFGLLEQNEQLAQENAILRSKLKDAYFLQIKKQFSVGDTTALQQYTYTTAQAINATTNLQTNYITLNKGRKQGINKDMGVISPEGLVGVVVNVSDNFSTVLPIINTRFTASVEVKRTKNFGLLKWDGVNAQHAKIEDIANHARLVKGDTVISRASSAIYPTGIMVGIIDRIEQPEGSNYLDLRVKLAVDFSKITTVYVIQNLLKREQVKLEEETIQLQETK